MADIEGSCSDCILSEAVIRDGCGSGRPSRIEARSITPRNFFLVSVCAFQNAEEAHILERKAY